MQQVTRAFRIGKHDSKEEFPLPDKGNWVQINRYRLSRILVECTVILLVMHLLLQGLSYLLPEWQFKGSGRLRNLFDVDLEKNIPSIFSFCLLLIASLLLAIIAFTTAQRNGRLQSLHWWILCATFFYLSIDELTELHEIVAAALRNRFHLSGIFWYAWVIPFGAAICILFVVFFKFLFRRIPMHTRNQFLVAAMVYIGGAMGMEMLSGWHFTQLGSQRFSWVLITTVEEGLEMIGIVYFIYALLDYIEHYLGDIVLHIGQPHSENTAGA